MSYVSDIIAGLVEPLSSAELEGLAGHNSQVRRWARGQGLDSLLPSPPRMQAGESPRSLGAYEQSLAARRVSRLRRSVPVAASQIVSSRCEAVEGVATHAAAI